MRIKSKRLWALFFLILLSSSLFCRHVFAQDPTPPFLQCAPAGLDTSCRILIVIHPDGGQVALTDPNVSPTYDGNDDTLIGVLNQSATPVASIPLTSTTDIFGFDGDGVCSNSISPHPAGCPFGPTLYEGPGVSFASISSGATSGVVNFSPALPKNGSAYFGLEEAIPTQCADADGDGLCDDWERNGLTVYVNGSPVFVDLPAMGANPNVPDIFVQLDHMDAAAVCLPGVPCTPGHTHQPLPQALTTITQAFAAKGITLHVDCGPTCVMNPKTGALWGALSNAHTLAHQDTLGTATAAGYQWADFDTIKNVNFSPARQQVFHYVVFAHNLGNLDGTSGISRGIPASDFIVSLGSWTASVGDTHEQGGTFMHELGHNLSFTHGGSQADGAVNYKPDYLSVMNYLFQMKGVIRNSLDFNYDYSESALPGLNEAALNETLGLGPSSAPYGTRFFCAGSNPLTTPNIRVPVASAAIDWNCNGAATDTNVATDINADGAQTALAGFADWPNIVYKGGAIGGLGLSLTQPAVTPVIQELSPKMDAQITSPYNVSVLSPGAVQLLSGGTVNLTFTITNKGTQPDTYLLTPAASLAWADLTGVPGSASLDAGASTQIPLSVTVPAGTAVGTSADFSILAASQSNANLKDIGYAHVSVAGGAPRLGGTVFSHVTTGNAIALNLQLKNQGPGPAANVQITSITARPLAGTGSITLASPSLPYSVGTLAGGGSASIPVTLNVPSTVTRFTLVESGTVQDASGNRFSFSTSQLAQK